MKVAIVCDWLTGIGGAERVVLELHKLYPEAPIYTSQYDPESIDWFKDADVRTLWLQRLPKGLKKFLPLLRAIAFRRLDLREYDLVISSSGAEAKAVKVGRSATHICYCHAPTHYYWLRYNQYLAHPGFGKLDWLGRLGLRVLSGPLRRLDYRAAQKPTYLIANSNFTKRQIEKYYDRESVVIWPPVDTERFADIEPKNRAGFVAVGRQTPYKSIGLAVEACTNLNLPLTVIGNGPEHDRLVGLAGPSVKFITKASDSEVAKYMSSAVALIFPTNLDDFGITAVEAMATGTPVIAYRGGGPLDYIEENKTGLFFDHQSVASLETALQAFDAKKFNSNFIKQSAEQFSITVFDNKIKKFIDSKL